MATNKRTLGRIGFYCGLIVFSGITLFPFFVMLMTSFKSAKEAISLHPTLLPQQWTLEHYIDIFNPMIFPFVDYFRNSTGGIGHVIGGGGVSRRARGVCAFPSAFYGTDDHQCQFLHGVHVFGDFAGGAAFQNHYGPRHL